MSNNSEAPFYVGQRVVRHIDKFGYTEPGHSDDTKKGESYTVRKCFIGRLHAGEKAWGVELVGVSGFYEAKAFAPIEKSRIQYVAVSETLREQAQEVVTNSTLVS